MGMHTTPVTYGPTTRRMSCHDTAGGVSRGGAI